MLAELARADVIEFDVLPRNQIQLRALWAQSFHENGWHLNITSYEGSRIEIGVFERGSGEDKDEHALEGVRMVLGEHDDFEPTMFTFPHRHHVLKSGLIKTELHPANGSHPVMLTHLPSSSVKGLVDRTIDYETCQLHALYTLPKEVFVDKYQLTQFAQFKSGGIKEVRGIWGETDLEDPAYKTPAWGSLLLIDVPKSTKATTLELPLHLRYMEPVIGGGKTEVDLLPPELFWACENTVEGRFPSQSFANKKISICHHLERLVAPFFGRSFPSTQSSIILTIMSLVIHLRMMAFFHCMFQLQMHRKPRSFKCLLSPAFYSASHTYSSRESE